MAVTTNANTRLSDGVSCSCPPAEFVRPRFFFGQRLGVVDFTDWLWYHAGKQLFHNARGHEAGVLCGLRAERYEIPGGGTKTTILRVHRGAAFGVCGREVVVGVDQCIDAAAWYLQHQAEQEIQDWITEGDLRLYVGLRCLECPSDPVPAPRDPCGCDAGGCDYSRVREGFELRLYTPAQKEAITPAPEGLPVDLLAALMAELPPGPPDRQAFERALHARVAAKSSLVPTEGMLWLCCFEVQITDGNVVDLVNVDNSIPERLSLLSTAALQDLLLAVASAGAEGALWGSGPRVTGLSFEGTSTSGDAGVLKLGIALVTDASGNQIPLIANTFDSNSVTVHQLNASGWGDRPPNTISYETTPGAHLSLEWTTGNLEAGDYVLALDPPLASPVVDDERQPLWPLPYRAQFKLGTGDDGKLILETQS